jgi:CRISPR-associated protein Cas2
MYTLVSFDVKFKTNQANIEGILQHYGLRKLQSSLYAGDLDNDERELLKGNLDEIIREKDSVLIVPVCQSCHSKKENCGRKIEFGDDLYRVY